MWVAHANIKCGLRYMSGKGLVYLGIHNVRGGCEVLKEVGGDVLLVGEYVP